jgi:hypothetical protein
MPSRKSRPFRPCSALELEGRVVPSQIAPTGAAHAAAEVRPVTLTPAEIAQSNASQASFGFDADETLQSGYPVAEQLTTTYNDGSIQTESLLEVPNIANNTITTYETINLRNNGGTEKVVDTETFSSGRPTADGSTIPFSGSHRTHAITITLPNGSTKTETETVVITGNKTVLNETINEPNGGVETWTTDKVRYGPTTVANKTIKEPDGSVEHQKIITTKHGELDSTTSTTTILPDGAVQRTSSATNVMRVSAPHSSPATSQSSG